MRALSILSFASIALVSATLVSGLFSSATASGDAREDEGPGLEREAVKPATTVAMRAVAAAAVPGGMDVAAPGGAPALPAGAVAPSTAGACPTGMALVEGKYCPNVKQECVKYMEDPIKFPRARCLEFAATSECLGTKIPLRFCMDKLEAAQSDNLPVGDISWTDAQNACKSQGKRLCEEREWVLACEGETMEPYPYGRVRDSSACNFDKTEGLVTQKGELADLRQPVDANPRCESPYGIRNMVGNIDEWVVLDKPHYSDKNGGRKMMSGLKGGWWGPMRNRCRPTTVDHDEIFHELQTGYRCCASAELAPLSRSRGKRARALRCAAGSGFTGWRPGGKRPRPT